MKSSGGGAMEWNRKERDNGDNRGFGIGGLSLELGFLRVEL